MPNTALRSPANFLIRGNRERAVIIPEAALSLRPSNVKCTKVWDVGLLPRDRTVRVDENGDETSSKIEMNSEGDGKQQVVIFVNVL